MKNQEEKYTQLEYLQEFKFEKTPVFAGNIHMRELIALKPIVENLGLSWSGAYQRIQRDEKLSQLCVSAKVFSGDNRLREMVCMRPFDLQDWLWDINESENLNLELWKIYKKGLAMFFLNLLRTSLEETNRLKTLESQSVLLRQSVLDYMADDDNGKKSSQEAKGFFKAANVKKANMLKLIENFDPGQLRLF